MCLGDEVFARYCPKPVLRLAERSKVPGGPCVSRWTAALVVWFTRRSADRRAAAIRKQMLDMDEHLDNVLAFSGQSE